MSVKVEEMTGNLAAYAKYLPITTRDMIPSNVLDAQLAAIKPPVKRVFEMHCRLDEVGGFVPPLNRSGGMLIPEPLLTWDISCQLVIEAFNQYDPNLGERAAKVLTGSDRVQVNTAAPGGGSGYCRPSGYKGAQSATLAMTSDGTINDAVYLAHELGHLISNDLAQEAGFSPADAPAQKHLAEVQGMFMQNIFYDYMEGYGSHELRMASRKHRAGEETVMVYRLCGAYASAGECFSSEQYRHRIEELLGSNWGYYKTLDASYSDVRFLHQHGTAGIVASGLHALTEKRPAIFNKLVTCGGTNTIIDVLEVAGAATQAELEVFFKRAVAETVKPVEQLYAAYSSE